jgi:DNA-binding PadR family transcriptional regulator
MTKTMQLILRALMDNPERAMSGLEICAEAGLPTGTIHPTLARLLSLEWVQSRWEQRDPNEQGRPRRRIYHLNPDNMSTVQIALQQAEASPGRVLRLRPGLAG